MFVVTRNEMECFFELNFTVLYILIPCYLSRKATEFSSLPLCCLYTLLRSELLA
jgi:hypothetical protein